MSKSEVEIWTKIISSNKERTEFTEYLKTS